MSESLHLRSTAIDELIAPFGRAGGDDAGTADLMFGRTTAELDESCSRESNPNLIDQPETVRENG